MDAHTNHKLADIMIDRSKKSFEEMTSEYSYADADGSRLHDKLSDLNDEEVSLHDVITKNVFKGIDYYALVSLAPLWTRNAGHSQESAMTKDEFETLVKKNDNELTHRFLYYHDCEMLMNAFQNRTQSILRFMDRIFSLLSHNHARKQEVFLARGN